MTHLDQDTPPHGDRPGARPYPYLGHGVSAARKDMAVYVAFREPVPDALQEELARGAPAALSDYFDWDGRTLCFGHGSDSLQWVVAATYPGAGPRAAHGETTDAQWEALRAELDAWLAAVHAKHPINYVVHPIDEEYSTETSAWHEQTVARAPSELWPRMIDVGEPHAELLAYTIDVWRAELATKDLEAQERALAALEPAARELLERHGGVPDVVELERPEEPPDLDAARAIFRVSKDPDDFARRVHHDGYDLGSFVATLRGAKERAEAEQVLRWAITEHFDQLRFPSHWWCNWARVLVELGKLDEAVVPLRSAVVYAESYSSSPWDTLVEWLEKKGRTEDAAVMFHGASGYVTGFDLSRRQYARAPSDVATRFPALLREWMEPAVARPDEMRTGELSHAAFVCERIGGALAELAPPLRAVYKARRAPYDAILEAARGGKASVEEVLALSAAAPPDPVFASMCQYAGDALVQRGELAGAARLYERALEIGRDLSPYAWNNLLVTLQHAGRVARANELLPRALAHAEGNPATFHSAACVRMRSGDAAGALALCKKAKAHGYAQMGAMREDDALAGLRGHPEFEALFVARTAKGKGAGKTSTKREAKAKAAPKREAKAKAAPKRKAKAKATPKREAKAKAAPKRKAKAAPKRKAKAAPKRKAKAAPKGSAGAKRTRASASKPTRRPKKKKR